MNVATRTPQPARSRRSIKRALCGFLAAIGFYGVVCVLTHDPTATADITRRPSRPISATTQDVVPAPQVKGAPIAVAPQTEHDFGSSPVETRGEHRFVIANVGTAPLQLSHGSTSCRCTLAKLTKSPIPPGETAEVHVTWTTRGGFFSQRAVVRTNDPQCKEIEFTVKGKVLHPFVMFPADVVFANLRTAESQSSRVTVYSQLWDAFEIAGIETSNSELNWKIVPADPVALAKLDAKSGYELELASPALDRPGYFNESLKIRVQPPEPAEAETHTLTVQGHVLSRIALYGADENRIIALGTTTAGQSLQRQLTLRVRDQQEPIQIEHIEVSPSFLKVTCEPFRTSSTDELQYRIHVEVPTDAPVGDCSGSEKGHVLLVTDHPLEKQVRFEVSFAVEANDD